MVYKRKIINHMILETLKQYVLFVCTICTYFNMYTTDAEQNHLAKYIKEFKVRPQSDSKLKKKAKEIVQWHFLKEEKWCLKHLKVEYFQDLNNQNIQKNRYNQAAIIN